MNETKVYPAVGACIYCGTTSGKLSKEHIIPLGLGGNLILPSASCESCAKITSEIERFCLRPMLGPFRIRLNLPTRRRKQRPSQLPLEFIRIDGSREETTVPSEEFPMSCTGFRFPAPGLLRGVPATENFEGELVVRLLKDEVQPHLQPAGQGVKLGTADMLQFARLLAKIAHSYAVAEIGLGAFEPMLPDLILGKSAMAPYLVGGDESGPLPDTEPALHHVYRQDCLSNGTVYALVAIRLFAFAGMPRYHVVAGPIRA